MSERRELTRRMRSAPFLRCGPEQSTSFSSTLTMGVNMFKSKKAMLAALAALSAVATSAQAAVPEAVTIALDGAKADGATVAGAVLVIIVGIAVFKYMRRGV